MGSWSQACGGGVLPRATSDIDVTAGMVDAAEHLGSISDAGAVVLYKRGTDKILTSGSEMGGEFSENCLIV